MKFSPDNFLYMIKQLVTGHNGDDTPVAPQNQSSPLSSAASADGGVKKETNVPLVAVQSAALALALPALTDNSGGTASTTIAVIADAATANAIAQIALQLNRLRLALVTDTTDAGKIPTLVTASGSSPTIGTFSFPITRDYDETSDHLFLRIFINLANADAAITLTGTPTVQSPTGVDTTFAAVTATLPFSTVAQNLSTTEQVLEINLSGLGLVRDDVVAVTLALVGTTTGNTNIFAIEYLIDSCIVSFNETTNTDDTSDPNSGGVGLVGFGNPLR